MHNINIDSLSEEELVELNHKVVARLRFLREMLAHLYPVASPCITPKGLIHLNIQLSKNIFPTTLG
jgi:hypothetical protein